jgi:hypothetical protein
VLLPSYLGHRCDNRRWRGLRLDSPWDRIRANAHKLVVGGRRFLTTAMVLGTEGDRALVDRVSWGASILYHMVKC